MTSRRRWVHSIQGEGPITHHNSPHPLPKCLSSVHWPSSTLCTCTFGGARAQLTVCLLSGEQEKPACEGVIDDYGTTASGIMLARAIYKQKHGLCLCQLWRILPFLSQTLLERAFHSGSNVIFYWESTVPRIEMAKGIILAAWRVIMLRINILQLTDLRDCRLYQREMKKQSQCFAIRCMEA